MAQTYVLLGGLRLLHRDLLLLAHLGQHAQRLVKVATFRQLARHLDLLLHLLRVMHDEDGEDALSVDLLAIGAIRCRIDDDLCSSQI